MVIRTPLIRLRGKQLLHSLPKRLVFICLDMLDHLKNLNSTHNKFCPSLVLSVSSCKRIPRGCVTYRRPMLYSSLLECRSNPIACYEHH